MCSAPQLRKEVASGCADAVQQAQHLAAAMQSDLVGRLQQQEASTQQALTKQQAAADALKQQLQDQAAALTAQQQERLETLAAQQKQQSEVQAAALSQAGSDLRREVDAKLNQLELMLTGRVNDMSAGKAALTDSKLTEIRCGERNDFLSEGRFAEQHVAAGDRPPNTDELSC